MNAGRDNSRDGEPASIATNDQTFEETPPSDLAIRLLSGPFEGTIPEGGHEQLRAANDNHDRKNGSPTSGNSIEHLCFPSAIERAEIPLYFRQFQNAAVLKKLAHSGKGPLYQLIGKKAWYETADIIAWLASRKGSGPQRPPRDEASPPFPSTTNLDR